MSIATTVFVEYDNKHGFTVTDGFRKQIKYIVNFSLFSYYKYQSEFDNYFMGLFPGTRKVVYYHTAKQKVNEMIEFNRIDK